jgi:hypothetical protein
LPPLATTAFITQSLPMATSIIPDPLLEFSELFNKIDALKKYGIKLQKQRHLQKGQTVTKLADDILKEVANFSTHNNNKETIIDNLSKIISDGKKSMGKARKATDIIAHIVLALTGIGLAIVLIKKWKKGTFFINTTYRQKLLRAIHKEIKNKNSYFTKPKNDSL